MHTTSPPTAGAAAWLDRIDALLAKAASTEFPEEAEALLTKAQHLMARHRIDDAMLAAAGRRPTDDVTTETTTVAAPYASAKAALLGTVAHVNQCRVVMQSAPGGARVCVMVGHGADLAATRDLYAGLSAHAVRTMLSAPVPTGDTARRFRHSFLLAFAARIGERLRTARSDAESEARRAGASGLEVVLANRHDLVERAFRREFPNVRTARVSSSSGAGHRSGRAAANSAALGQQGLRGGFRRGLPGGERSPGA